MERRRWKVFSDTGALIAGILSPTGAAHEVLRLCEAGVVQAVVSRQVPVEADRNLTKKVPALLSEYRMFSGNSRRWWSKIHLIRPLRKLTR